MAEATGDSRRRLIDAAVELVLEHHRSGLGLRTAFGYLTPGAVARRAGLSRALIYHHWGDGEDAMGDLLGVVAGRVWQLGIDLEGVEAATAALGGEIDERGLTLSDVVVALAAFEMERVAGALRPATRAAHTVMLNGLVDPADVESAISAIAGRYAGLGEVLGLEPVPPLTWNDLAFAVSSVAEGFVYGMNLREDLLLRELSWTPAGAPPTGGPHWNLYGVVIESVLRRMVRPTTAD